MILPFPTPDKVVPLNSIKVLSVIAFHINIPAVSPETKTFIGKGFIGCSEQTLDTMRIWCSIIENNQPLESLFKSDYPEEFINTLDYLRKQSFNRQRDYLEKVFNIIDKNDDELVKTYLQNNIKYSYDWCRQFKVPIASHYYLVAD